MLIQRNSLLIFLTILRCQHNRAVLYIEGDYGVACVGELDGYRVADLYDCQHYYICNGEHGARTRTACETGYQFHPAYHACILAEKVGCSRSKPIQPIDEHTTKAATATTTDLDVTMEPFYEQYRKVCGYANLRGKDLGYLRANDCRYYYACVFGEPILHACPEDTIFNVHSMYDGEVAVCNVPSLAECNVYDWELWAVDVS